MIQKAHYFCLLGVALLLAMCGQPQPRKFADMKCEWIPFNYNDPLALTMKEFDGEVILSLRGVQPSGSPLRLNAGLVQSGQLITVDVRSVGRPGEHCAWSSDLFLLRWDHQIGKLDGTYDLHVAYQGRVDRYRLTVTPSDIHLQPIDAQYVKPIYTHWRRLPPDAVWFLAGYAVDSLAEAYRQEVVTLRQRLDAMGCAALPLTRDIYAHKNFLSPWPDTWQLTPYGTVEIPAGDTGFIEAYHPILEYYTCPGSEAQNLDVVKSPRFTTVFSSGQGELRGYHEPWEFGR